MGVDYYNCGSCNQIERCDYMAYCHFCDEYICHECVCGDVDEDNCNVGLTEDELKRDENGNYIIPDGYNCDCCDKRKQNKADEKRKNEILKEILGMVLKKNTKKCKELIKELQSL